MAANTGDFKNAGNSARGEDIGIIPPVKPTQEGKAPKREAAVYVSPADFATSRKKFVAGGGQVDRGAPVTKEAKEEKPIDIDAGLKMYQQVSGKKAISMEDTMTIAHHFVSKLEAAHAALSGATSAHATHPDLPKIRTSLAFARQYLTFADDARRNKPVLDEQGNPVLTPVRTVMKDGVEVTRGGNPKQVNQTPLAWQAIKKAGEHIKEVHGMIKRISPDHVSGISYEHVQDHGDGTHTVSDFTPENGLTAATQPPTEFKSRGADVTEAVIAGKKIKLTPQARLNLATHLREQKLGIKGVQPIRGAVVREFGKKTAPTARVRKKFRIEDQGVRKGALNPKNPLPMVEKLGEAAVQPRKTGGWSGAEQEPLRPGQGYARGAEKLAVRKKRRARTKYTAAATKYVIAKKSDSEEAMKQLPGLQKEVKLSAIEYAKSIGEVKRARNRDITYATGTPKPRTRKLPKEMREGK